MIFSKQLDQRVYVDDEHGISSDMSSPTASNHAADDLSLANGKNLPMLLQELQQNESPWRKDSRFAMQLLCVILLLNIGLYFAFNYTPSSQTERLALRVDTSLIEDENAALEERVLTYSKATKDQSGKELNDLMPAAGGPVTVTYPGITH